MVNGLVEGRGSGRWPKRYLSSLLMAAVLVLAACSSPPKDSPTPAAPTGFIQITVSGPSGDASILVTGPDDYSETVTASTTLEKLAPGDYTLEAAPAGGMFVVGERTLELLVASNEISKASFEYARAFDFTAATEASSLSLGGATELAATLGGLHPDLDGLDVALTAPAGWDLLPAGPWEGSTAGTISTVATDTAATFGPHEFVFTVTGNLHGQALQQAVTLSVDLAPVVTNTTDDATAPQQGSLRYLIENPRVQGQTITFDPEAAVGSQIVIELQEALVVEQSLSIVGFADPATRVRLTHASGVVTRLLDVRPPNPTEDLYEVTLSSLEFVNGAAPVGEGGGAIRSHANLTVTNSLFTSNWADHGGAIFVAEGGLTATGSSFELNDAVNDGGAVYADNLTRVELRDSTFEENYARNGGAVMVGNGNPLPADRAQALIVGSGFYENLANDGGALRNSGDATIETSHFVVNESTLYGGAISVAGGSLTATNVGFDENKAATRGGAVYAYNATSIELLNSTFTNNQAFNGGAVMTGAGTNTLPADRADVLIENSTFEDNIATGGAGAFLNHAIATVRDSRFERNEATSGGGAIRNHYKMVMETTQVVDNEAGEYGGILSDGIMEMSDSDVINNRALTGDGGGIYSGWAGGNFRLDGSDLKSLTIVNSRVTGNRAAGNGGGIYSVQILEITDSTVADNTAGGVGNADGGGGGGGVFALAPAQGVTPPQNADNRRGETIITGSTFSGNEALAGNGGAIVVDVEIGALEPIFTMTNSTVAYNTAEWNAGGLWLSSQDSGIGAVGVESTIVFSTIVGNESTRGYGGGVGTRYGDLLMWGSIIANNVMLNPGASPSVTDVYRHSGGASSHGYIWITSDPVGSLNLHPTDVAGLPTTLGELADNGGPTQTIMPTDTQLGNVPLANCKDVFDDTLTTDQRGSPRPGSNGMCYRGAVEPN